MTAPYATGAPVYAALGFTGLFPVDGKRPALAGVTGRAGIHSTPEQYAGPEALEGFARLNLGWHLPPGYVGIDVDAYEGKEGASTLAALEAQLCPLPATVSSTARGPGLSRIHLFRVPENTELAGVLEAQHGDGTRTRDVEVVQAHHRYAVVWPSVHPGTGGVYRWYRPDGSPLEGPPSLEQVAALPGPWLERFGKSPEGRSEGLGEGEAHFRSVYTSSSFPDALTSALGRFSAAAGSRHDSMLTTLHQCAREAAAGAYPAALAFDRCRALWDAATEGMDRDREFSDLVRTACESVGPQDVADQKAKLARFWDLRQTGALAVFDTGRTLSATGESVSHLPSSFWSARPVLTHIRDAAHAGLFGADAVFYGVLARLSSMVPPALRVDTGILSPVSLNLAVAVVAASGVGKSTGETKARDILPAPQYLVDHEFGDCLPLGSGEGLAEAYFGTVEDDQGDATAAKGKVRLVRRKVRDNNFFVLDEGTALTEMLARQGTTVASALRSAVSGATIGQQNARAETTRVLVGGSYSAGFLLGFQPQFAGKLFHPEYVAAGTPQRFLFAKASDPSIPDISPGNPGPLDIATVLREVVTRPPEGPFLTSALPQRAEVPLISVPQGEKDRIRAERLAMGRGEVLPDPLDSQSPALLAKIAGLLAVLDSRTDTTQEDWDLARMVWATSCAVRHELQVVAEQEQQKENQARVQFHAEKEAAAALHTDEARASVQDRQVSRLALRLAGLVHRGEVATGKQLRSRVAGRDKKILGDARDFAVVNGWIVCDGPSVTPGPVTPA